MTLLNVDGFFDVRVAKDSKRLQYAAHENRWILPNPPHLILNEADPNVRES